MKKVHLFNAIALVFVILLSSCDSEPIDSDLLNVQINDNTDDDDDDADTTAVFKVDFNNTTWTAATASAQYSNEMLSVSGINANGSFFVITVPNPHVGTFEFAATQPNPNSTEGLLALAYMVPGEPSGYVADSDDWGTFASYPAYVDTALVTITEIDTVNETVTGTFKFTGGRFADTGDPEVQIIESITFTNGEFTNISYGETEVVPNDNVLTAKLDGADYTATAVNVIPVGGNITISAQRGSVEAIALIFPDDIIEGNYDLGMFTYVGQYNQDQSSGGAFLASGGTLTITAHDTANNHITGTFHFTAGSFTGSGTHEITDGTFDVTY
jgi:Family of unknown function (DUF6252)